ncbi:WD40-repeat-containing domain protein [Mycena belliarum]|uniref:WD40-repeat-containing domain protein n=1 Tax=Mycena belliarum TaxID=1033014 RepID=A0AAD6XGS4_9AGAR|nr:WD40-repeat-containing domain protein [Mycena belliae]
MSVDKSRFRRGDCRRLLYSLATMALHTVFDVDAFDDSATQARHHVKRQASTPILISDDEIEMVEVDEKLTTRISTRSRSATRERGSPPAAFIDLVSDDEITEVSKPGTSASVAQTRSSGTALFRGKTSRRSAPNASRSSTPHGSKPIVKSVGAYSSLELRSSSIVQHTGAKKLPSKPPPLEEFDTEDEYEHTADRDPFRHPTESPTNDRCFEPVDAVLEVAQPTPSKKRQYVDISSGPSIPPMPNHGSDIFIWNILPKFKAFPYFRPVPRGLSRKRQRLPRALDMDHYHTNHYFHKAGGAINKILQHDGRVVVCSNTAGGDFIGDTDPYNKAGTLISWCKREPEKILDLELSYRKDPDETYYSVHCVAYDPAMNILACSTANSYVRTWKYQEEDEDEDKDDDHPEPRLYRLVKSKPAVAHDLAFKPGDSSLLAVGEENLTIEDMRNTRRSRTYKFSEDKHGNHVTGAIAWGSGPTSSLIFALSEPRGANDHRGYHMAVDVESPRGAFKFDAPGAGDALCVNETGTTVALVTNDGSESCLRIYDVSRSRGSSTQERTLEPFTESLADSKAHEVNSMAFSSDSIYLALGRDDNHTHVYDSRMLGRGILFDFQHEKTRFTDRNQEFFGVVKVEWVNRSGRLGLVTGGNDGCVRLWDPLRAHEEGVILAQANYDIATFALGDPFKGEHELIVGDSSGAVYVLDGHASTQ